MRLYLSSHRVGDRAGSLLALLGSGKRVAVIANALDGKPDAARAGPCSAVQEQHLELASLGLQPEDLDLRHYFGRPEALRRQLHAYDLVWALGDNPFVLRRAMRQSGLDDLIVELLDRDEIAYGGSSAGAMVASPTLRGLEKLGDPRFVPAGYEQPPLWEGLGLVDVSIVPHFRSSHPQSVRADQAVRHLCGLGLRYRTLRDGDAIVWTETRNVPADSLFRIA